MDINTTITISGEETRQFAIRKFANLYGLYPELETAGVSSTEMVKNIIRVGFSQQAIIMGDDVPPKHTPTFNQFLRDQIMASIHTVIATRNIDPIIQYIYTDSSHLYQSMNLSFETMIDDHVFRVTYIDRSWYFFVDGESIGGLLHGANCPDGELMYPCGSNRSLSLVPADFPIYHKGETTVISGNRTIAGSYDRDSDMLTLPWDECLIIHSQLKNSHRVKDLRNEGVRLEPGDGLSDLGLFTIQTLEA